MRMMTLIAMSAMSIAAFAAPAVAQDAMKKEAMMKKDGMMSSDGKKMSMADKKMMTKCQGMSHDMMMKNKGCMKMMKMHPDMMNGG